MFHSTIVCLVILVVGGCQANTFRLGACPRVLVMQDVDVDKILGDWYVVQRFNPMATCTKMNFKKSEDGFYSVNETARPLGLNVNIANPFAKDKTRKLEFLRNDTKSIFRAEKDFAHFTLNTFGIIDTDYTNYALLWGCDPVLFGSVQNVDILSRTPDPEPAILKASRKILKEMSIDYSPLDNVDQSSCSEEISTSPISSDGNRNTHNMVIG